MTMRRRLCALTLAAATFLFLTLATYNHFLSLNPSTTRHFLSVAPPTHLHTGVHVNSDPRIQAPPTEAPPPLIPKQPHNGKQEQERSCSCDSCVSNVESSDWFSQRYDPKQQPILTQNHTIDPSSLQWWKSLQRSGNGRGIQEVMSELFSVIAPPTVDLKPHPLVCRKCAVVGNSGRLSKSGYGHIINSHQFVIRMNKAVVSGYEADVGNKSTHHFLYPESAVDLRPGVSLVLLPFKIRDMEWVRSALSTGDIKMTYMRVRDRVEADKDKVLVLNPGFFKYVHDRWTQRHGRYPSTGMMALIYALHTCDQVSVFGFGADSEGNWHHYWEQNRFAGAFRKTGVHNADYESEIIHQLNKEGKITLYL